MTDPVPLTPADCDLRDFQYMELDVRRLRDSKFAATPNGDAFRAGLLLWCAAWHQVPAASLPDDDAELANFAGFGRMPVGVREWKKLRAEALAGFVKCSDGRLYHGVVAEKALQAWDSRLHHAYDKWCDRIRKENKKRKEEGLALIVAPPFEQWNSTGRPAELPMEIRSSSAGNPPPSSEPSAGNPAENPLRGNREGEGKGEGEGEDLSPAVAPPTADPPTAEDERDRPAGDREDEARNRDGPPSMVSKASAACAVMRSEGIARVNGSDPRLLEALERGAGMQHFADAAKVALERKVRDPFAYAITVVEGQLADAESLAAKRGRAPSRNGHSGSAARAARMAEAVPSLAANGHGPADFLDTETRDVTPRSLG